VVVRVVSQGSAQAGAQEAQGPWQYLPPLSLNAGSLPEGSEPLSPAYNNNPLVLLGRMILERRLLAANDPSELSGRPAQLVVTTALMACAVAACLIAAIRLWSTLPHPLAGSVLLIGTWIPLL